MESIKELDRKTRDKEIWIQDEVFDTIWNDKIDKFFENYEQFDKYLVEKSGKILSYWWHVYLDAEESWKLYSDFWNAFIQSIKWIVGDDLYKRLLIYIKNNDYLLSNRTKMNDGYPFLDDEFQCVVLWDNTIAQFFHRRDELNHVEFNYTIYPNRIFSFIDKLCKELNT